ncbi:hypothetical protein LTR97_012040 [Elasticomyces elasticus]|uniref:Transcriptional regulatory protein RXT2 N-terminal domain-containing protein n=1 Tax=Elasticomyces elasticus TaxID=574655 RepID=A0AAN7ZVE6_9PEZI|nr:hypothetical protein LTR97_012040 [Elasticomyces elasticus]
MATQALAISETIRAMKLALRRSQRSPSDSSDNDSDTLHTHTNRGQKLRPSSRYAHEGRLDTTGGQARYKRKIVHGGYTRSIINKRPRLYDEDGDAISPQDVPSDDEVVGEYGEAVEEDPFGGVRLEVLMAPLTSASQLAQHPGLRGAYLGSGLSQMAGEAAEMVRRERASLWRGKRLLERFRGDGGFMDCGRFETEGDEELLMPGGVVGEGSAVQSVVEAESNGLGEVEQQQQQQRRNGDAMEGVEVVDHVGSANPAGDAAEPVQEATNAGEPQRPTEDHLPQTNGDTTNPTAPTSHSPPPQHPALTDLAQRADDASSNSGTNPSAAPSHRMTTRARARSPQQPTSPSPSPSDSASVPSIHPWFHFPTSNLPDRDLGLPAKEAEDTRRLLLLYVQKQENIVRQLSTLYEGLQRTDRLRRFVWRSSKAEGHVVPDGKGGMVTEMSDGEDWFDVEELNGGGVGGVGGGIEGEVVFTLEKGKDEVDDTAEEEGRRVGGRRRRVVGR